MQSKIQNLKGLEFSELFFEEIVRPILAEYFPKLSYTAALIGSGSEILGFDTEMSQDHDWGPRLQIFLTEIEKNLLTQPIFERLSQKLPKEFRGFPTFFSSTKGDASPHHHIEITTIPEFIQDYLNFDIENNLTSADWLSFPEQKLRTIIEGRVYQDEIDLQSVRERFSYYPKDVWLYLLASAWNRIGQEEHLMGRAGIVGDEIGSAIIGARLVRDIMKLCFLMEQKYAPYPKWFGTAFARLSCAEKLSPILQNTLHSHTWQEREAHLCMAYEHIAERHNALKITPTVKTQVHSFHERPFKVIHLENDFCGAILAEITDSEVLKISQNRIIGGIDQWSDSTDILSESAWRSKLWQFYTE